MPRVRVSREKLLEALIDKGYFVEESKNNPYLIIVKKNKNFSSYVSIRDMFAYNNWEIQAFVTDSDWCGSSKSYYCDVKNPYTLNSILNYVENKLPPEENKKRTY